MSEGYGTDLLVVTNAAAGSADEDAVAAAVSVLRDGAAVEVAGSDDEDSLHRVLDARAGRTLVVVGGDGSVHTTVAVLRQRGELDAGPLGLVPLGTGNDLARTLGIPLDPAEAAGALLRGRPRELDLVVDDTGGVVVNVVHVGVGAVAAERATSLKPGLGAAAYALGGALAGVTEAGWDLQVTVDGEVVRCEEQVLMVAVANGRTIGGGAELAPDADPSDGLLDVVVATSTGPLARMGFASALREGEHVDRDDVTVVRGRTVTVRGEPFPVNADGELGEPVRERTWTVEPAAWSVVVPATSSAGSA